MVERSQNFTAKSGYANRLTVAPEERAALAAAPCVNGHQLSLPRDLLLGLTREMADVRSLIECVAPLDVTVLVWGESGVGKELVARALHNGSSRCDASFVKVNCAALPLELLESELFGYERGAFTGATRPKPGKFDLAGAGTIFLDEIAEIPLPLQAKLLQVLQNGEFSRLGGRNDIRVDARVIAATNTDLRQLVDQGRFRADLYYRLNVMTIFVPPLRERREEVPLLTQRFLLDFARLYERKPPTLSWATLDRFQRYPWPGNVRELENTVRKIVILGSDAFVADELRMEGARAGEADSSEPHPAEPAPAAPARSSAVRLWEEGLGLREIVRRVSAEAEQTTLHEVLDRVHWNRLEAARRLRVSYKTLLNKMKVYGLG
jgi:transcriptional regulator with GAF, ATPase, and Fis domain